MRCAKCGVDLPDDANFCLKCGKKLRREPRKEKSKRPNGTGSVYREGKSWTAEITKGYTLSDGKMKRIRQRRRGFASRSAAMDWCHASSHEEPGVQTLEKLWQAWSESDMTQLSSSKQTAYTIAHNKLLKTNIAFVPIAQLRTQDLQRAMDSQCATHYTARDFQSLLSKLYQRAMADQDVTINLARLLTLPELDDSEPVPFDDLEQVKIWQAYTDGSMVAGCVLLMIYTGMMPGELLACRKDMIDWDGFRIVGDGLKTRTRKQTPIVFPDIIEPVLRHLCEWNDGPKLVKLNRDNFYKQYHAMLRDAGCRDLPPYSCRHTTATALDREHLSPALIQRIMRHAKYTSTLRYIHQNTDDMRTGVNALKKPSQVG